MLMDLRCLSHWNFEQSRGKHRCLGREAVKKMMDLKADASHVPSKERSSNATQAHLGFRS